MGSLLSRKLKRWMTRNDRRLLLVGLDGAGKSTILQHLKPDDNEPSLSTMPTIGFNIETLQFDKLTLNIWVNIGV